MKVFGPRNLAGCAKHAALLGALLCGLVPSSATAADFDVNVSVRCKAPAGSAEEKFSLTEKWNHMGRENPPYLLVKVVNTSEKSQKIHTFLCSRYENFELKSAPTGTARLKSWRCGDRKTFPFTLKPEQTWEVEIPVDVYHGTTPQISVGFTAWPNEEVAQTEAGKTHWSKPVRFSCK